MARAYDCVGIPERIWDVGNTSCASCDSAWPLYTFAQVVNDGNRTINKMWTVDKSATAGFLKILKVSGQVKDP